MTEQAKAEARKRRRETEARRVSKNRRVALVSTADVSDPAAYLEGFQGALIGRLTELADESPNDALEARICLDLLKMTSAGRTRIDVTAHQAADPQLADALKRLSIAELERLAAGGALPGQRSTGGDIG